MRQSPSQQTTLLLLLLPLVLEVESTSTGAPASACKEMEPRHNFKPQNQHHNYQVTVERSSRHFTVTVASLNKSWPFKGFMMRGFRVKGNKTIFFDGVFESGSVSLYQHVACGESFNRSVITHKNPGDKTHVNATWKPEKITEPLIEVFFRSDFVKHPDYVPTVFRYSWRCCCATTRPLVETAAERANIMCITRHPSTRHKAWRRYRVLESAGGQKDQEQEATKEQCQGCRGSKEALLKVEEKMGHLHKVMEHGGSNCSLLEQLEPK
ncbi:hypothetical protein HPB50_026697 [Hyalomma asiaticum]|uniref:Uncharacterized protein n=1 Tax=Hyalomma asiaticum TaxID=266040 RepID=A0ACB7T2J0_HYAAI|nr:hypothetical protein HPB50_026697 [Hyalomma asiaticum]